ncbi:phospholipase A2 inhibitor and Ly6/PLAUR domain-containing protein-like isoform X1 [Rana temporaria]|uniref:phospholipase A2 inhibitor and Ly6/PLAUR domain-containing protein-like isoform X1 n=1 Tax=Rana temporaria TaxID=8407 RepID=UPI001AAD669E|nr:phospholipase A2 inhibitor and Ly6/PLAUR domain-containing protein-like isoform X1 [Rana temporaria]
MNFILAAFIFSGVIATGNALQCNTCEVVDKEGVPDDCVGELVECTSLTDQCATQIEVNYVASASEGKKITTVKKGCFKAKFLPYCENRFEVDSNPDFYLALYTKCCNLVDGCNSGPIQMPPASTTENGRTCPACFAVDATTCTPVEKKCFGTEAQCVSYNGPAARPGEEQKNYVIQGCVTPGSCYVDFNGIPATKVESNNYKCY